MIPGCPLKEENNKEESSQQRRELTTPTSIRRLLRRAGGPLSDAGQVEAVVAGLAGPDGLRLLHVVEADAALVRAALQLAGEQLSLGEGRTVWEKTI